MGLIQTPTADSKKEGTVSFTFNKNDIWKFGTLSVSPFDWLEASYFYYRPSDLIWNNKRGHYLDKGFYFQVPMDLFSKNYTGSYSNFKLSPLTRDGGAKLEFDKDLRGLIYNSSLNELRQGWR